MKTTLHDFENHDSSPILKVMHTKVVEFAEIVVCLFESCNLKCSFCPQDHLSIIGASRNEILSKVAPLSEFIRTNTSKDFHVHIMGGELFQDRWINAGFLEIYADFISEIKKNNAGKKNIVFNFVTNLVTDKIEQLIKFCQEYALQVSVSYDPAGRFNSNQLNTFKKNVELMHDHIRMISCVITNPNIEKLRKGDDYFDHLYQNFSIDWDQLIPALENSTLLMPKESQLLDFHKLLLDYYPKCINMESFVSAATQNRMRCTRGNSLTIMPDNSIPRGCSGAILLKKANEVDLGSHKIVENFVTKYNCLSCEFYARCPFTCFIKQEFKDLVADLDDCVFKETFRYAKDRDEITD